MVIVGIFSTVICKIREQFDQFAQTRKALVDQMMSATSYAEYSCKFADLRKLDRQHKRCKTPAQESKLYSSSVFKSKTKTLKDTFERVEEQSDVGEMVRNLREDLVRSLGNMQDR